MEDIAEAEYQITDRVSFQRFLGLSLGARVPDAKTIWLFKDTLAQKGVIEVLFKEFNSQLESKGLITHTGTIIDATFVNAPRQRNTRDENQAIKRGEVPENWASNPHKMAQKDRDARWTKKNTETHYGYKAHVKVDMDSKIVTSYSTTSASVHDSNEFVNFLDEKDQVVYADSAYSGQEIPAHIRSEVCEKGCRNKKLSEAQKANNRRKSKVRCRIEHVFGFMTCSMRGITVRSIGLRRAEFNVGLTNLVYNLFRYSFLAKKETI